MSFTPYNAPLLAGIYGDMEIAGFFSVKAELAACLRFEVCLAQAQAACGLIPNASAEAISSAIDGFEPDLRRIGEITAHDGVIVPELVRQLRERLSGRAKADLHFDTTSQDVTDTSLMLRLGEALPVMGARLAASLEILGDLDRRFGGLPLMARTRMQAAIPIMVGDRIANWKAPLEKLGAELVQVGQSLPVQLGGPAGTLAASKEDGARVRARLAGLLGLSDPLHCWHADRIPVVRIANVLSALTGALGKLGQDVALMAQNGIDEISLSGGGKSSAMAHKSNPVLAESLVTLARFNAVQISGMHQALVHEQERSGSAWALEWMILPQMAVAAGAALRNADKLLRSVERIGIARSAGGQ